MLILALALRQGHFESNSSEGHKTYQDLTLPELLLWGSLRQERSRQAYSPLDFTFVDDMCSGLELLDIGSDPSIYHLLREPNQDKGRGDDAHVGLYQPRRHMGTHLAEPGL